MKFLQTQSVKQATSCNTGLHKEKIAVVLGRIEQSRIHNSILLCKLEVSMQKIDLSITYIRPADPPRHSLIRHMVPPVGVGWGAVFTIVFPAQPEGKEYAVSKQEYLSLPYPTPFSHPQ